MYSGEVPATVPELDENISAAFRKRIKLICDQYAGIIRTPAGMARGAAEIELICTELENLRRDKRLQEAYNMALTAQAVFTSAARRIESCGTHYVEPDASQC